MAALAKRAVLYSYCTTLNSEALGKLWQLAIDLGNCLCAVAGGTGNDWIVFLEL